VKDYITYIQLTVVQIYYIGLFNLYSLYAFHLIALSTGLCYMHTFN